MSESKITRADLEAKFREVQTEFTTTAERAKDKVLYAAAGGALLLVILAYVLGRRSGRRATVVEIRRL